MVHDEYGRPLDLTRLVGSGGQGDVWAVDDRLAVKLLRARTQRAAETLHRKLRTVRRFDLDGLPISRPLAVLAPPHIGYVMELAGGMTALRTLSTPPAEGDLLAWYAAGGGLRRRLRLLARIADVLAALHSRGIVYGDPSPGNVMVSVDPRQEEVWLVDVDNLEVESRVAVGLITPGYTAPEVVSGRGVSSLSDAYAFAVIVFETLAVTHPFEGDRVLLGPPELRDRAFAGELPWIDDPDDTSNRSGYGLSRTTVLAGALGTLATRVFTVGRRDPVARPTLAEWRTALHRAAGLTLTCSSTHCAQAFFVNRPTCPWCGSAAPAALVGKMHLAVPQEGQEAPVGENLTVQHGTWTPVNSRVAHLSEGADGIVAWLLWQAGDRLVVRNVGDRPIWIDSPQTTGVTLEVGTEMTLPTFHTVPDWVLRFGLPTHLHRALRFQLIRERV